MYTFKFEHKYPSLEIILQETAYYRYTSALENVWLKFQNLRCVHMASFSLLFFMHFKNRFRVYLKYTLLINYWWTVYLKHVSTNHFPIIFIKLKTLGLKISPKVYLKYTLYLEYRHVFEVQCDFSRMKYYWKYT